MTPHSSSLRLARPQDNVDLIALARSAPMEGSIRVFSDRGPDFFTLSQLQGDKSEVLVYEDSGQVVGSIVLTHRVEKWFGKPKAILHAGDLRVAPSHRSTRIARSLVHKWFEEIENRSYAAGGCEVIKDNHGGLAMLQKHPSHFHLQSLGQAKIYQLLPLWVQRFDRRLEYRSATLDDLPELSQLLSLSYDGYNGQPEFSVAYLQQLIDQHPSFDIEDIWIAEKHGKIAACAGFWDQLDIRRTVVERFSPSLHFAVNSIRMARPILRLPEIPRPGDPLRYAFVRFPAHLPGEKSALQSLIRFLLNRVRQQGQHQFIWLSFHENDPMKSVINGLIKLSMEVNLFHMSVKTREAEWSEEPLLRRIPYIDFSLV
ncbi:MAG: GNAT family N-acetyltransferase [Oligoflexus sp.]